MYIQLMIDNTSMSPEYKLNENMYSAVVSKVRAQLVEFMFMDKEGGLKNSRHLFILNQKFNIERLENILKNISYSKEIIEEVENNEFRFLILLKMKELNEEFWYNVSISKNVSHQAKIEIRNYGK